MNNAANPLLPLVIPEDRQDLLVVASVSGGKDSTALILALIESGIAARYVFSDTGWEAGETYVYLDFLEQRKVVEWARTDYGGKQFNLFDAPPKGGCMKLGVCDIASSDSETDVLAIADDALASDRPDDAMAINKQFLHEMLRDRGCAVPT